MGNFFAKLKSGSAVLIAFVIFLVFNLVGFIGTCCDIFSTSLLFSFIIELILVVAMVYLFVKGDKNFLSIVVCLYIGLSIYSFINAILTLETTAPYVVPTLTAAMVFDLLVTIAMLMISVIFLLVKFGVIDASKVIAIIDYIALAMVVLYLISGILIMCATEGLGWYMFITMFGSIALLPVIVASFEEAM